MKVTLKYNSGKTGVFIKGGSIIPRKNQIRRSTELMMNDPYSLIIAVDDDNKASGELYVDDGKSFDFYNNKGFINKIIKFDGNKLTSINANGATSNNKFASKFRTKIDRIVVAGLSKIPSKIPSKIQDKNGRSFEFSVDNKILTIDRVNVKVNDDFEINFEY